MQKRKLREEDGNKRLEARSYVFYSLYISISSLKSCFLFGLGNKGSRKLLEGDAQVYWFGRHIDGHSSSNHL